MNHIAYIVRYMSNVVVYHLFLPTYSAPNIIIIIRKGSENTILKIIPITAIIRAMNITIPTIGSTTTPMTDNTRYNARITNKIQNKVIINHPPSLIFYNSYYFLLHRL